MSPPRELELESSPAARPKPTMPTQIRLAAPPLPPFGSLDAPPRAAAHATHHATPSGTVTPRGSQFCAYECEIWWKRRVETAVVVRLVVKYPALPTGLFARWEGSPWAKTQPGEKYLHSEWMKTGQRCRDVRAEILVCSAEPHTQSRVSRIKVVVATTDASEVKTHASRDACKYHA